MSRENTFSTQDRTVTPEDISRARTILHALQNRSGKPGSGISDDTYNKNSQRLRALDEDSRCRVCLALIIRVRKLHGNLVASLGCKERHDPLGLYLKTDLGDIPFCQDYERNQQVPISQRVIDFALLRQRLEI